MKSSPSHEHKGVSAKDLVASIRERGFRITKIRQEMLTIFSRSKQPLSAQEILAILSPKHPTVNKTTIYRELEFLVKNSVVAELDILDGMKRYELLESGHHHHHLVCKECRDIQCVEVPHHDLDALESRIQKSHNFKVTSHVLEFFGLCKKCAS
jgi:Fur family ferric uptake transcriptional regulator